MGLFAPLHDNDRLAPVENGVHGDAQLTDLLHMLADCPKARRASIAAAASD
jgi:hypothetical protein